ncbi:hypothetical protein [Streptomyces sp. NRRL S-146]|uniref:hypothetical protein n=1 Tax=Streptomyces sp. NRRL S-146 TaxID=1463884 RepID=UPI0004C7AA0D|nr:hypothetical protein [Streptomyces sp. NRRL S-146]
MLGPAAGFTPSSVGCGSVAESWASASLKSGLSGVPDNSAGVPDDSGVAGLPGVPDDSGVAGLPGVPDDSGVAGLSGVFEDCSSKAGRAWCQGASEVGDAEPGAADAEPGVADAGPVAGDAEPGSGDAEAPRC